MTDPIVPIHCHTSYSLLDGAAKIKDLVARAAEYNMPGLHICDHGHMYGVVEFYKECKKYDINPIIGEEFYFCDDRTVKGAKAKTSSIDGTDKRYFHLTTMAVDNAGYQNLMRMSSEAFLSGFHYKARCDWELLERFGKGLIITTGCLGGPILQELLHGNYGEALARTQRLVDIMGKENVYVELQDHGLPEQHKTNPWLIDIAKKLELKTLAAMDLHYVDAKDVDAHSTLLCCQTGSKLSDSDRFQFQSDQHYLMTAEQMRDLFKEVPEACDNTLEVNERCNVTLDFQTLHLPNFPVPPEYPTPAAYLSKLAFDGLLAKGLTSQEYLERLAYELSVIDSMGVSSYFLIVWDLMRFARSQGIRRGPGRGSAAAALVSLVLGITDVDPIRFNLPFERFLNPSRISMPDIDLDWPTNRREEIINYTIEKYGRDYVAQVITFSEIKARSAVRDAARILGLPPQVGDRISKVIPPLHMGEQTPLKDCFTHSDRYDFGYKNAEDLRNLYNTDPEASKVIDIAKGLEGLIRQDGIGAAAVVVSPEPLTNLVPVQKKPDSPLVTQFDKKTIEELGLLKMDFLGLRNLDIIEQTLSMIDEDVDIDSTSSRLS